MRLFRLFSAAPAAGLTLLLALSLAACKPGAEQDAALIGSPEAGDLYAAQLSAFSEFEFSDGDEQPIDPAYGLMKVVEVDGGAVVVVTENAALGSPEQSRRDLRGDMADIGFDDSERIRIESADLRQAHTSGLIYAVRRPAAE